MREKIIPGESRAVREPRVQNGTRAQSKENKNGAVHKCVRRVRGKGCVRATVCSVWYGSKYKRAQWIEGRA